VKTKPGGLVKTGPPGLSLWLAAILDSVHKLSDGSGISIIWFQFVFPCLVNDDYVDPHLLIDVGTPRANRCFDLRQMFCEVL
jgi:hypothetical protein